MARDRPAPGREASVNCWANRRASGEIAAEVGLGLGDKNYPSFRNKDGLCPAAIGSAWARVSGSMLGQAGLAFFLSYHGARTCRAREDRPGRAGCGQNG